MTVIDQDQLGDLLDAIEADIIAGLGGVFNPSAERLIPLVLDSAMHARMAILAAVRIVATPLRLAQIEGRLHEFPMFSATDGMVGPMFDKAWRDEQADLSPMLVAAVTGRHADLRQRVIAFVRANADADSCAALLADLVGLKIALQLQGVDWPTFSPELVAQLWDTP